MPRNTKPEAPAKVEPRPVEPVVTTVTNTVKGFTMHLGDGRKLAFGESAEVGEELAAFINGAF